MKKLLIILSLFAATLSVSYAEDIAKGVLAKAMNSVVSVVATSQESDINEFLKSSNTNGNKGSGVIIDVNGLIITNSHVVADKPLIKVILNDGRILPAKIKYQDADLDLVILEIQGGKAKFQPIKFAATSSTLDLGDKVYAIGNPYGLGLSVTSGIISALSSKNNAFSNMGNLIQTDASLNPGNSGGALLNVRGELIGITVGIYGDESIGIGFAIPIEVVKLFINRSINGEKIKEYGLGFNVVNVSFEMINKLGLSSPTGVIITNVSAGGAGDLAGVKALDVILSLGGKPVDSTSSLAFQVASIDSSEPLDMVVLRKGQVISLKIRPAKIK
ncbi:MAG: trypsin-like peptidase domain-containing protein [Alphaproteobacteria bacterium]|jgi:S1-C subfamily serine protease|nr:trypsin-like peptidase domain-containing protein [Alphaproteobacteria bacterium]